MCTSGGHRTLLFVAVLVVAARPHVHAQLSSGSACVSPDGRDGSCTTIRDCPFLWELLTQRRPIAGMAATDYLRRSQCGFQGRLPVVCCPGSTPTSTPASRPPTPRPPVTTQITRTVITPLQSQPIADASSHRNRGLLPQECGHELADKIVGGTTAQLGEHPWVAGLEYQTRKGPVVACGGALISRRYVLTAAHCIVRVPNAQLVAVRLGEHNLNTDPDCVESLTGRECADPLVRVLIERVTPHPQYQASNPNKHNDIGIVRLRTPANFTDFVRPVCLPSGLMMRSSLAGTQHTVAGWGRTETRSNSDVKLNVKLPVLENARCSQLYSGRVQLADTQMCAGGQAGKDSCSGDSGGPLMTPQDSGSWVVTGVVSVGPPKCGTQDMPGVYTRVAPFVTWILDNMRNDTTCFTPPVGDEGECVNIRECPTVLAMLRVTPRPPDTVQKLQAAQCGVDTNNTPKVCCPITTDD